MVKKWAAEFKRDRVSLEDDLRLRRPVTVTIQETIVTVHDIIMADRRVTEHYIITELGISKNCIHAVIHNDIHMSKVSLDLISNGLGSTCQGKILSIFRRIQKVSSEFCDYG